MSIDGAFDKLLQDLDNDGLATLGRALAERKSQLRQLTGFQIESIRANMSEAEKELASREIARVLRGEE